MGNFTPLTAIIGLSAIMLMWFSGRIAGISGIFFGAFGGAKLDTAWRWWFIVGLLVGAGSYLWATGPVYAPRTDFPLILVALAGIIVGLGTQLGSGCTSGHGVCGIARFSMRSISATITFMITGIATTYMVRHIVGVGL